MNLPAEYENIANFRIRFRWQNDFSDGTDPAFLVDNIQLIGVEQACIPPTVDAGQNAIFCEGGVGIGIGGFPTAINGSGNYSYSWSPETGLNDPSVSNPIAVPSVTTNYTVTVTDLDNNCSASDDVLVTVLQLEELLTSPAGTITTCDDDDIQITATSGFSNYVWTSPSGNVAGQSIMASEPGVYQVSATGSNGCPSVSEEVEIILVSPQAITVTASGSLQLCSGEQVTLTAQSGFSDYEWNGPEGEISGISVVAGTAGDWYVTATDINGCETVSQVQQISVSNPALLQTTPSGIVEVCQGGQSGLSADDGFTNYVWTSPSGNLPGQNIVATNAGSYYVTATDANGCESVSEPVLFGFFNVSELNFSPSGDIQLCSGDAATLIAEGGYSNYLWNSPSGVVQGVQLVANQAGTYSVSAVDANGCLALSGEAQIDYYPAQQLDIEASGTDLCAGDIMLSASGGFSNWEWSTPGGSLSTEEILATEAGLYGLTATDINGCETVAEPIDITGGSTVIIDVTPAGSIDLCAGETVVLQATTGMSNYQWNGVSGSSSLTVSESGTWQVSAISAEGCDAVSEVIQVTVHENIVPGITVSGDTELCPGESVELIADPGFADYVWVSGSQNLSGSTLEVSASGTWQLNATDVNGCPAISESISVSVLQPQPLNVTPSGTVHRCPGLAVTFTASSGFSDYLWDPVNIEGSTLTTTFAGTYTVSATSPEGCIVESAAVVLDVYPEPPFIGIFPTGPVSICEGESITLVADTGYTAYLWSNNGTGHQITVTQQSTYIVTANDSNGCVANSQSVFVDVIEPFSISISQEGDLSICEGQPLQLIAEGGFNNYVWSDESAGQQLIVTEVGSYSVSAQDEFGCSGSSAEVEVSAGSMPVAAFTYLQTEGYTVEFTSVSMNADAYFWDFGSGNTSTDENPVFDFLFDDEWPVTLIVSNSCGSDTLNILVDVIKTGFADKAGDGPRFYIQYPNVFLTDFNQQEFIWRVFSVNGALICNGRVNNTGIWQLPELSEGMYVLEVFDGERVSVQRFTAFRY